MWENSDGLNDFFLAIFDLFSDRNSKLILAFVELLFLILKLFINVWNDVVELLSQCCAHLSSITFPLILLLCFFVSLEDEAVDWREPALVRVELIALSVKSGLVGVVLDASLAHHILISLRNQRDQEVDQNDC
mgnify:FL=1